MLCIEDRLSLALMGLEEAQNTLSTHAASQFVAFNRSRCSEAAPFSFNDLGQLYCLSMQLDDILSSPGGGNEAIPQHVVICAGEDSRSVTACVCFLGCYMLLLRDVPIEQVTELFQPIDSELDCFNHPHESSLDDQLEVLTVHDAWQAVQTAKEKGWVDFLNHDAEHPDTCIDMEEYLHYSNPANGRLHVIIPSELIAFQRPSDPSTLLLPDSTMRLWADSSSGRHFSPAFYADILGMDYGVQLVVQCDAQPADPPRHRPSARRSAESGRSRVGDRPAAPPPATPRYDPAAFRQRGIAVERLPAPAPAPAPARSSALLRGIDRFLTLARLAPGPVALHGPGMGLGPWGEMLAAVLLVQRHGFDGRAALAWLRIAHPPASSPHLSLAPAPAPPSCN